MDIPAVSSRRALFTGHSVLNRHADRTQQSQMLFGGMNDIPFPEISGRSDEDVVKKRVSVVRVADSVSCSAREREKGRCRPAMQIEYDVVLVPADLSRGSESG